MTLPVIGLGAGGHAKVVIEILKLDKRFDIEGMLDLNPELHGTEILEIPVLGDDSEITKLLEKGIRHFFVGLGSTSDAAPRKRLYQRAIEGGMQPVDAVHPAAIVSPTARFGRGVTVMANAVINASVILGENVIINTGAVVEHDCVLGDHVHIATGARLASTVEVGDMAHIGVGASVRQLIKIGDGAVVGAGAVVVKDVPAGQTVVGNPARPIEK
jgi:UDP-perosamine 4-acetyltransferase